MQIFSEKIKLTDEDKRPILWQSVRADSICDTFMETGNVCQFKSAPLLGIQDLGSEPQETMYMGNRVDVIRQILEYRGDKSNVLTLITSNYKMCGENIQKRYGDRVVSRLSEMCNYLEIRGVSKDKASMVCMDFNGTYAYVSGEESQTIRDCVKFYVEESRVFALADLLSLLPKEIEEDFPNVNGGIDAEYCYLCTQWCINGDYADNHHWSVFYTDGFQVVRDSYAKELVDALYGLLLWCLDNHVKLG